MWNKSNIDYTLYLVTDRNLLKGGNLKEAVEKAILGGATIVQLREKNVTSLEFYNIAKEIKAITDKYNVPFIIDDRLDIALSVGADGLHIGQSDLPAKVARSLLGSDKILGVSAGTLEEAVKAEKDGADYLGVGAVFPTDTKKDAAYVNLDILKEIKENVHIPVVAIGGINGSNISLLKEAGIDGVAVVSAIMAKEDLKRAAEDLRRRLDFVKQK